MREECFQILICVIIAITLQMHKQHFVNCPLFHHISLIEKVINISRKLLLYILVCIWKYKK